MAEISSAVALEEGDGMFVLSRMAGLVMMGGFRFAGVEGYFGQRMIT